MKNRFRDSGFATAGQVHGGDQIQSRIPDRAETGSIFIGEQYSARIKTVAGILRVMAAM
ncbi:hypothetical protein D3C80_1701690 [compost metagenome]